ncbi:MAG: hypothetical protein KIT31_36250 [Deltaproteobacteria bacterium]|nr:hypothetical protein [Deltaproteobacteria bacterium]
MRARPTLTAAFAVVVLVGAQLAAHAHAAAARHITCAEHGEQLEAVVIGAHPDDGNARWVSVEKGGGEHDECLFANALRQSGLAPAHPQVADVHATADATQVPPRAEIAVAVALYRLAPKTSPPRA